MTNNEQIIQFLLNLPRYYNDNTVAVSRMNIQPLNIDEDEIMRTLFELEAGGYIRFKQKSPNNDLSMFATVELLSPCLSYFDNKKKEKRTERNNWIQFWIPVGISIIALLKSFSGELAQLWRLIMRLMQ